MHICERKRGAQSWGDILFLTGLYEVDTGWCQVVPGGTRLYKVVPGDTRWQVSMICENVESAWNVLKRNIWEHLGSSRNNLIPSWTILDHPVLTWNIWVSYRTQVEGNVKSRRLCWLLPIWPQTKMTPPTHSFPTQKLDNRYSDYNSSQNPELFDTSYFFLPPRSFSWSWSIVPGVML